MIFQCTGGGILVPIFINSIPVPLMQDAYPVTIICSFFIHLYFPIIRDVVKLSPIFHTSVIVLYEILRAAVVVKLTAAAGKAIPASEFSFPIFGPIFCGSIAGCGGVFLPLSKGLDPIKQSGLAQPMLTAFIAATFYHLVTNLATGVIKVEQKAHVLVACFFVLHHLVTTFASSSSSKPPVPVTQIKKEL